MLRKGAFPGQKVSAVTPRYCSASYPADRTSFLGSGELLHLITPRGACHRVSINSPSTWHGYATDIFLCPVTALKSDRKATSPSGFPRACGPFALCHRLKVPHVCGILRLLAGGFNRRRDLSNARAGERRHIFSLLWVLFGGAGTGHENLVVPQLLSATGR